MMVMATGYCSGGQNMCHSPQAMVTSRRRCMKSYREKYQALKEELEKSWQVMTTEVPVVLREPRAVTPQLEEWLQQISRKTSDASVQKGAMQPLSFQASGRAQDCLNLYVCFFLFQIMSEMTSHYFFLRHCRLCCVQYKRFNHCTSKWQIRCW